MIFKTYGNIIYISYEASELSINEQKITLPDGYSFEDILVVDSINISTIQNRLFANSNVHMIFPPINSKSPCTFFLYVTDLTKSASIRILICKFGQIPDANYFDKAFEPILVVGDDGKEYNVIPSDQFK
jgi:hypothetical protein